MKEFQHKEKRNNIEENEGEYDEIDLKSKSKQIKQKCKLHNKELKYLKYSDEEASVIVCKSCKDQFNITQTFSIKNFMEPVPKFTQTQKHNYDNLSEELKSLQDSFAQNTSSMTEFIQGLNEVIDEQQLLRALFKDQQNILFDIKSSIQSFQSGNLSNEEFQVEISNYFQREKVITKINHQRYKDVIQFFKKMFKKFQQFRKSIESLIQEYHQQQNNELQQIQLSQQQQDSILEKLNLYKKSSLQVHDLNNNLRLFSQHSSELQNYPSKFKLPKVIENPQELTDSNDLRMITSKNKFAQFNNLIDALEVTLPFSRNLKVFQLKNHSIFSQQQCQRFLTLMEQKPLYKLNTLELDISRLTLEECFSKYISQFHFLYPKLKNVSLTIGFHKKDQIFTSIVEGLEPIIKQINSFQFNLSKIKEVNNNEHIQNLLNAIVKPAINLKVISLKFQIIIYSINDKFLKKFQNLFEYIVSAIIEHILLEVFDISLPFYVGEADLQMSQLANIIKQNTFLRVLKLNFNNFKLKDSQLHQILSGIEGSKQLQSLKLKFSSSCGIGKQGFSRLTNIIHENHQIQELVLDFTDSNSCDEETFIKLSQSIFNLFNLTKFKLKLKNSTNISDVFMNYLSKSLENIQNSSKDFKIEEFELNLHNCKEVTDKSLINLLGVLKMSQYLRKLKLGFFKNEKIGNKSLENLALSLKNEQFQNLRCIMLELGNSKINTDTLKSFLKELNNNDQLTKISFYFGPSLFNNDIILEVITLINQCSFLTKVSLNFYQSNAFTHSTIRRLIQAIAKLHYLSSFHLDIYNIRFDKLNDILKTLEKIEKLCFGNFQININSEYFYQIDQIQQYINKNQSQQKSQEENISSKQ